MFILRELDDSGKGERGKRAYRDRRLIGSSTVPKIGVNKTETKEKWDRLLEENRREEED